VLSADEMVQF
jgi:integrase/recombinase XerD